MEHEHRFSVQVFHWNTKDGREKATLLASSHVHSLSVVCPSAFTSRLRGWQQFAPLSGGVCSSLECMSLWLADVWNAKTGNNNLKKKKIQNASQCVSREYFLLVAVLLLVAKLSFGLNSDTNHPTLAKLPGISNIDHLHLHQRREGGRHNVLHFVHQ